jgi:hypothetical protein
MSLVLSSVSLTPKSHMPADVVQNSFVFAGPGTPADTAAAADAAITRFYNGATGDASTVASFIASYIDRATPVLIKSYVLAATSITVPDTHIPPGVGSPIATSTFTLDGFSGSNDYPPQVAAVLSLTADLAGSSEHTGTGPRTAERRRGRLFIGPLSTAAASEDPATHAPVLSGPFLTALRLGFLEVAQDVTVTWMIWSRKDNLCREIVKGHADNRFDSQRRRDQAPTFRATWNKADVIAG